MAEFTASSAQSVAANSNVLFTSTPVTPGKCIIHRDGSGLVNLRGLTNQNSARFLIQFSGNIAVPTGGTAGEIALSIAINGEEDASATMLATPAAVGDFSNVSTFLNVSVPRGCCVTIAVENSSTQTITVQNANLIVTRVA